MDVIKMEAEDLVKKLESKMDLPSNHVDVAYINDIIDNVVLNPDVDQYIGEQLKGIAKNCAEAGISGEAVLDKIYTFGVYMGMQYSKFPQKGGFQGKTFVKGLAKSDDTRNIEELVQPVVKNPFLGAYVQRQSAEIFNCPPESQIPAVLKLGFLIGYESDQCGLEN